MNLNKAFVIGNLTRDPEMRTLPSGASVVSFGLATNRIWTNQSGEKQQDTQFHNIVAFGKTAEIANQYLKKGSLTCIEGRIQTRNWDAQDGTKRTRTEIVAERLQLGPRRVNEFNNSPPAPASTEKPAKQQQDESLDTIEYPDENSDPDKVPF